MASKRGDAAVQGRRIRLPRLLWVAAVVVLVAVLLAAQSSTVLVPNLVSYRLVDPRTISLRVGVAPCSWTRVTGVVETQAEIRITVETLPCPIPGPGTAQLDVRELTVSVADDIGIRTVADAVGHPIPMRAAEP